MGCYVTPREDMQRGAYILADPHNGLRDGALLFPPGMAELARGAAMFLAVQGIALRLIQVENAALFLAQGAEYRDRLLAGFPAAVLGDAALAAKVGGKEVCGNSPKLLAGSIKKALFTR